jgi:LuxR family transcriptional regulator, transcriptional regulator of spore coat protein
MENHDRHGLPNPPPLTRQDDGWFCRLLQTFPITLMMTLTNRQQQVLDLIAAELTTAQIAGQLGVAVATVETHRRNLFRKAGVRSVAGLVKEAMRQGLIQ